MMCKQGKSTWILIFHDRFQAKCICGNISHMNQIHEYVDRSYQHESCVIEKAKVVNDVNSGGHQP